MGPIWAFSICTSSSLGMHIILHLPVEYRPNRTIRDIVMSSYPFLKTATTASHFYFPFRVSWLRSRGKVEIYLHTKFRRDISIHCWDFTTSGFWKQTSTMLEFYVRFLFSRLRHHRHVILHLPTKFRTDRTIRERVMESYPVSKMAATILLPDSFLVTPLIWKGRRRPNFGEKC